MVGSWSGSRRAGSCSNDRSEPVARPKRHCGCNEEWQASVGGDDGCCLPMARMRPSLHVQFSSSLARPFQGGTKMLRAVITLAIGVVVVAPVQADPPKELSAAAKRQLKALEGKWRVVRFLHPGRETAPEAGEEVVVEFKGRSIDFAG